VAVTRIASSRFTLFVATENEGRRVPSVARYVTEHGGRRIEVEFRWTGKCKLFVDSREVDSGSVFVGTFKLQDTTPGSNIAANVDVSGPRARVTLLAGGEQIRIPKA
jgi:hypothetical protein